MKWSRSPLVMAAFAVLLMFPFAACGPPVLFSRSVFQHNVEFTHTGAVRWLVSNGLGADHIFLQELCHEEADEMRNLLLSRDYEVLQYEPSYRSTRCGENWGFGEHGAQQIVASKHASIVSGSVQSEMFPMVRSGQGNGYACARFVRGGYSTRLCTAHLESSEPDRNIDQGNYLLDVLLPFPWYPTIVGGDFNRTPNQLPVTTWRSVFGEVDPAQNRPTYPNNGSPYKKVDYVFIQSGTISSQPGAASVSCYDTSSDHCFLRAIIQHH